MYTSKLRSFSRLTSLVISGLSVITIPPQAWSQSGGPYVIQQSVIAAGGTTNSSGGTFSLGGTSGQPIAGQKASNGAFTDHAGFWIPDNLLPTAERVMVSGRVLHTSGVGIRNVRVSIQGPDGQIRSTLSSSFGYFQFDEIEIGQTYIFTASSRKYSFQQPTIVRSLLAAADDLNFIALDY